MIKSRFPYLAVTAGAAVLAGCNPSEPAPDVEATDSAAASAPTSEVVTVTPEEAAIPFGDLTDAQLLDADLITTAGTDIADIEGVVTDTAAVVTHLVVEIEDTDPDRYVQIPVTGLSTVADGAGWDIATDMTREDLLALSDVPKPDTAD